MSVLGVVSRALAFSSALFLSSAAVSAQTMTPLYNFTQATGSLPSGSLMQADDGNFYGVTRQGGAHNCGTIFRLTPAGVETVLYSFTGSGGEYPVGGLVEDVDGLLYGVTAGGPDSAGTIFSISLSGTYKTVATLNSSTGPQSPVTQLIVAADGSLYGAAKYLGTSQSGGVLFKVTQAGAVSVVYSFTESNKSILPNSLVIATDGNLYGTTVYGGTSDAGIVFRVATNGSGFTILHNFTGVLGDGSPICGLVEGLDGTLYGVSSGATVLLNSLFSIVVNTGAFHIVQSSLSLGTVSNLLVDADGILYGVATGLDNTAASVFKLTPTGVLTNLASLDIPLNLNITLAGVALGLDGNLYGLSNSGGLSSLGFAFKIALDTPLTPPINISLSEPTITLGNTIDLIYQLENGFSSTAETCSAHGSGTTSGAIPASGTLQIIPQTAGTVVYAIVCGGVEAGTATLNVARADSSVEATSGPSKIPYGTTASITVKVNGTAHEPTPTGSVSLSYQGQTIAQANLNSSGEATLSVSTTGIPPNTYQVVLNYSGDLAYKSSSANYTVTISKDSTLVSLVAPSSLIAGQTGTATATVSRGNGPGYPSGTVTFRYGSFVIGSATVTGSGVATLTHNTINIDPATYPITATYNGDADDASAVSSAYSVVIHPSTSTTVLRSSSMSVKQGSSVTLTATVTRSVQNIAPAGTMHFYSGSREIGSVVLQNGVATFTASTNGIPKGTYPVDAVFAGDKLSTGSTSNTLSITIQ